MLAGARARQGRQPGSEGRGAEWPTRSRSGSTHHGPRPPGRRTGVRHPNIICDCCKKHGLRGMRWKCRVCFDYDLCTQCYMHDRHDLAHAFERYETAHSRPVTLSPRQGLPRIPLRGIFQGAKVVRGPDWEWGSQDGGAGKPGRVVDIRGWDVETGRSVASVTWADGTTNVYRVGHKGKVDLKCVGEAAGGFYYKEHLPRLGKPAELRRRVSADGQPFQHGDKVKCLLDTDILREMQEGHGGWNPRMAEFIGQTGTVHRITDRGDVRVQFGRETRWTFHPGALTKHNAFWVGDAVRVIDDLDTVKRLQAGHGEWTDDMAPALGRVGKVVKVFRDGNLRVVVGGQPWTFSPSCLVAYRPEEDANLDVAERARENKSSLSVALDKLRAQKSDPEHPGRLVVEVALGSMAGALDLLRRRPEQASSRRPPAPLRPGPGLDQGLTRGLSRQVDTKNQGRTALQVAAYLGQVELVRLLLQARAAADLPDDEGNTALHYAALGNQPEAARLLLSSGCGANALNGTRSTALHVAVQRGFLEVVRVLCERGCDVNLPDAHANTPLHCAISAGAGASGIVEVLTEVPGIDVTATNSQGFTLLHHASLKGHTLAVRRLLARARQLVDAQKDDGFTALHLATLNNHREVAQILIREGRCDVNVRNRKLQSPLHLAVQQAHAGLVPLLVDAGCSVNAEDEEGDTALHVALQRHQLLPLVADGAGGDPGPLQLLSRLQASGLPGSEELTAGAAIACFLALEGADLSYANHRGRSPLDLAAEGRVLKALQGCAQRFRERHAGGSGGAAAGPRLVLGPPNTVTNLHVAAPSEPEAAECLVCSELALLVLFSPCQHRTVCEECARRMKKCIRCQVAIGKKLRPATSASCSSAATARAHPAAPRSAPAPSAASPSATASRSSCSPPAPRPGRARRLPEPRPPVAFASPRAVFYKKILGLFRLVPAWGGLGAGGGVLSAPGSRPAPSLPPPRAGLRGAPLRPALRALRLGPCPARPALSSADASRAPRRPRPGSPSPVPGPRRRPPPRLPARGRGRMEPGDVVSAMSPGVRPACGLPPTRCCVARTAPFSSPAGCEVVSDPVLSRPVGSLLSRELGKGFRAAGGGGHR
ncbi:E3 ubiquitin-protein ligase MIB2 isoform X5 [Mustela lutreola]|uniref:E3 ubiquitin-protein ligase MIB2 isoform X5 n=1 Tax=Mustela lutreola TaxID=9666 RepID=UPI0027977C92|nr:E3 ubiquitin-protein ligase MIB2 isoform X5 [Mustela lutreola]